MIDYTEGAAAYEREAETKKLRKAELAAKRAVAYEERNNMAEIVRVVSSTHPRGNETWMTVQIAAEVLRNASITQITRARRAVRKRYFGGGR